MDIINEHTHSTKACMGTEDVTTDFVVCTQLSIFYCAFSVQYEYEYSRPKYPKKIAELRMRGNQASEFYRRYIRRGPAEGRAEDAREASIQVLIIHTAKPGGPI